MRFCCSTVKYLREVTPYFRPMSVLNEVGWTTTDATPRHGSLNRSVTPQSTYLNRKSVPLKLCYLCQNVKMPDSMCRTFEIHSSDGASCMFFRCPDEHVASEWMAAVHTVMHALLQRALADANELLKGSQNNSGEVYHMAWMADQVNMNGSLDTSWTAEQASCGAVRFRSLSILLIIPTFGLPLPPIRPLFRPSSYILCSPFSFSIHAIFKVP